jgi:hypothetical protein
VVGCGVVECELHVTCSIILIVIQLILIFSIVYSIFFSEVVCVYVMREPRDSVIGGRYFIIDRERRASGESSLCTGGQPNRQ